MIPIVITIAIYWITYWIAYWIAIGLLCECYLIAIGLHGLLIANRSCYPLTHCGHRVCASDKVEASGFVLPTKCHV